MHVFQKSTSDVRPVGGQQAGRKTLRALDRALGGGGGGTGPVPVPGAPVQLPKKVQGAEEPGSLEQDGKVVEKPKSKAAPTETTPKDADDDNELSGKVTVSIGGQVGFNTAGDAPKGNGPDKPNLICDHGTIQLAGQLNVPWKMNQGNKLKLLPEFDLTADFGGLACGQRPTFGVQVSAFKLQHGKFVELALNAAFQVQGPPTGWIFQAGPELDIHLGTTGFFKHLEIDIAANGGLLLIPRQESRGIGSNFLTGQGALQGVLKYTF